MRVYVGFDPRELAAYQVAAWTIRRHASIPVEVEPLVLEHLRWKRLYERTHEKRGRILWDVISGAPMATEFALTRFLVPHLMRYRGVALFVDCDFLFRGDVAELFALADPSYAVQVVKHPEIPVGRYGGELGEKMDGQKQTFYRRKNWSSCMLFNCAHDMHAGTLERVAKWRGLWLHQFRFLQDADIGELPLAWNWLEGISRPMPTPPLAVHFTRGTPDMPGYENAAYADEWRAALEACGGRHRFAGARIQGAAHA